MSLAPEKLRQQYWSYALMLISSFFWVSGYVYSNNHNLSAVETSTLRGFIIAVGCYVICRVRGEPLDFRNGLATINLRNILMMLNGMVVAWAQFYLPLNIAHTVLSTGPLSVLGLEVLLDGKKLAGAQIIGVVMCILGIVMVANGSILSKFLSGQQFSSEFLNYKTHNPITFALICLMLMMNQIMWAYTIRLTKAVQASAFQLNFHFGVIMCLINWVLYEFFNKPTAAPVFYWGLLWTGVCLFLAEICFVGGIKISVETGKTMLVTLMVIAVSYLYSLLMYHEQLNWFCLLGSLATGAGIMRIILH